MLSGSVCAGVGLCAPRSLSRQAAWCSAPAGSRAAGGPRGEGARLDFPGPSDKSARPPHPSSPGARDPPPFFFLLTGSWLSPPRMPRSGDPSPAHVRSVTPLIAIRGASACSVTPLSPIRGQSACLPSPAALLQPAQPKPPLESPLTRPHKPSPQGSWGPAACPREGPSRAGGRLKVRPRLHSQVPQSGSGWGTHAGGGGVVGGSPALLRPPGGLPAPFAVRSACIFPRGWRVSTQSP